MRKRPNRKLLVAQRRSLSLPRAEVSAMRQQLRANPQANLDWTVFSDPLINVMIRGYSLGYRSKGASLPRAQRDAKRAEYEVRARDILLKYQTYANEELQRIYDTRIDAGLSQTKTTQAVLRRFRTLGVTAPAYNNIETTFKTASTAAYNEGVWDATRDNPKIWGYGYFTMADERVRHPEHSQYHGVTLPKEHKFWKTTWPPIDWNCRCQIFAYKTRQLIKLPPARPVPIHSDFQGHNYTLS